MPAEAPLFELEAASFAVDGRPLLHPLTLEVPGGRFIGLIGHNGSGKSTLLRLLARQQPASSGTIRLNGKPLKEWGERAFARTVAYLPQTTPAGSGMLVKELAALGRYPWHGALGRVSASDRAKVAEALELTDLGSLAGRLVDTLSGGERQRAWIAMLVAQDTPCMLLDEPISALDVAHQIEILSMIRELSRARNIAVIAVLHDVNMAARFCDDIIALHTGRVVARGLPEHIVTPERLFDIYGVQMEVIPHPRSAHPVAMPL